MKRHKLANMVVIIMLLVITIFLVSVQGQFMTVTEESLTSSSDNLSTIFSDLSKQLGDDSPAKEAPRNILSANGAIMFSSGTTTLFPERQDFYL